MKIKFMCGCVEDIGSPETMTFDSEGFLVCTEHRNARRKGYRTLPAASNNRQDYGFAQYSPLEIEQFVVFGVPLGQVTLNLK